MMDDDAAEKPTGRNDRRAGGWSASRSSRALIASRPPDCARQISSTLIVPRLAYCVHQCVFQKVAATKETKKFTETFEC